MSGRYCLSHCQQRLRLRPALHRKKRIRATALRRSFVCAAGQGFAKADPGAFEWFERLAATVTRARRQAAVHR